ncbi:hypothetical protein DU38_05230 [Methanosarcina mazei]|uniref:Uncharacterized protein n=1 Tax=Methanosarcina mazei TaxID=2209 RepID=A0A0F8NJ51_METMZ|nr:hypothetical protein [Methanosarcina mazei]KKG31044.1 hypothetical protein DU49_04260 [Methanosarcina mazei]KKG38796.1 hypothetical protein DU35_11415 [Methanosarcina mazei]KKG39389.1 hypothetical protein DU41_16155 [Methanosarcina mazei]KKG46990.1 hypothetical protein DU39_05085 [Methanosarcina mazei]KKG47796.1 hypothetical protein DU38_05230 [Methanosarcina mazei]
MSFDFEAIRVTEVSPIIVKRVVTSIPVKKPRSGVEFFRIRPEPEWKFDTYMLDLGGKSDSEGKFLLDPALYPEVIETKKLKFVRIYTGITYGSGDIFLSEIAHPDSEGKDNEYNRTRRLAYSAAEISWVKLQTNESIGAYDTVLAMSKLPEPEWPEEPENINKALEIAFKDKIIEDHNHPVLKKLRGEL